MGDNIFTCIRNQNLRGVQRVVRRQPKALYLSASNTGNTPLMSSLASSHRRTNFAIAKYIVDEMVNRRLQSKLGTQDKYGRTALMHACMSHHENMANHLVKLGVKTDVSDNRGWTPLMYACHHSLPSVAHALLHNKKADVHATARERGYTALEIACCATVPAVETGGESIGEFRAHCVMVCYAFGSALGDGADLAQNAVRRGFVEFRAVVQAMHFLKGSIVKVISSHLKSSDAKRRIVIHTFYKRGIRSYDDFGRVQLTASNLSGLGVPKGICKAMYSDFCKASKAEARARAQAQKRRNAGAQKRRNAGAQASRATNKKRQESSCVCM